MEYKLVRRLTLGATLAAALVVSSTATSASPSPTGSWVGTLELPRGSQPIAVALTLRGGRATVDLAPGHANRLSVAARIAGARARLALPGRPAVVLELARSGATLTGSARQGATVGRVRLRRGAAQLGAYGSYRLGPEQTLGVVPLGGNPFGVVYETGEIRRLHPTGAGRFELSAGLGTRAPVAGVATFGQTGASWRGTPATRVASRALEVRFPSGATSLAGTLTLPPGAGPHPAVALVHGSGPTRRSDTGVYAPYFLSRGFAVLAYDKRGVGLSGGSFPGERASEPAIETYARDAQAAARFLAARPGIDRARVGLSGVSQAGWIMPRAASREPAVRFLVLLVAPAVTQGESDLYGSLTGQGGRRVDRDEIERQVRASTPDGVDPLPAIRRLSIPALWIYGGLDLHVPTALSVDRLRPLVAEQGRDFTVEVLPRGDHGLVDTATGLTADVLRSSTFADGLFETIDGWLRARRLTD